MQSSHGQYLLFPTAITCVIPPLAPVHGRRNATGQRTGTGLTVGSTVTYSCKAGYTLNGSSTITCKANGQWSGKAPECNRKLLIHQMYNYVYQHLGVSMQSINKLLFPSEVYLQFFLELYILESVVECFPSGINHTSRLQFVLAPV